jgi:hypothetical protein
MMRITQIVRICVICGYFMAFEHLFRFPVSAVLL